MTEDELEGILARANREELLGLRHLLWGSETPEAQSLQRDDILGQLQWLASSTLGYLFKEKSYAEIVQQVLRSLKVRYEAGEAIEELEKKLILKVLQTAWEKMTSEQRTQLETELARLARKANPAWVRSAVAGSGLFGALTAAQASGFSIYLAATTALATVTQGMGITLPFVAYTSLTRAIAVIIGPPGWIVSGFITALLLDKPNYKKLIPALLYIAALRETQQHRVRLWRRGTLIASTVGLLALLLSVLPTPASLSVSVPPFPSFSSFALTLPSFFSMGFTGPSKPYAPLR